MTLLVLFGGIPLLVGLAIILSLVWFFGRQSQARGQLNEEIAALQAAGMPVDDRSLQSFYRARTDNRRTGQWVRILEQLESPTFTQSAQAMPILGTAAEVPLPGQPWKEQAAVEAFLRNHQLLLDDLHDAASDPHAVWFPIEFNSAETLLPYAEASRGAARLLQLEHGAAVYAGQGDRAAQSVRSFLGLSEALRGEPFLVSQLVRLAIHSMALAALQRSLEHDLLDEEALADLLEQLGTLDDYQSVYRAAVAGERAMALPILQNPQYARDYAPIAPIVFGSRAPDALAALRWYERMEQVAEEEDLDAFVEALKRLAEEMEAEFEAAGILERYETIMTQLVFPSSVASTQAFARHVMHNRLAQLAVGVRLYRHRFGAWPEQLDELSAVGLDPAALVPLGGKPFGYRVEGETALLWGFDPARLSSAVSRSVPDHPPPLDDPDQPNNARWIWRLSPAEP